MESPPKNKCHKQLDIGPPAMNDEAVIATVARDQFCLVVSHSYLAIPEEHGVSAEIRDQFQPLKRSRRIQARNTKHLGANNRQPSLRKKQQFPALADQGPLKERKRCGRLVEKPASKVAPCDRCFPLPEPTLPHCHNRSRVFMRAKNASRVEVTGKRENAWFPDYVTNIYIVFRHLATPHGRTSGVKKDRHLRPQHPT